MDKVKKEHMRWFLSDKVRKIVDWRDTDQSKGLPAPPIEKPVDSKHKQNILKLPKPLDSGALGAVSIADAIARRKSRRSFSRAPLSLEELAFLLWAVQGVRRRIGPNTVLRTVPSAGGRHAFETYIASLNVKNLSPGLYRYLPLDHSLLQIRPDENLGEELVKAALGQSFFGDSAAVFIWSVIPYRMEWRYDLAAYRVILMDAGHMCQNLYLACEGVGAGTCAVGAYDQEAIDKLIEVDGTDEFTIYMAPVGKTK